MELFDWLTALYIEKRWSATTMVNRINTEELKRLAETGTGIAHCP